MLRHYRDLLVQADIERQQAAEELFDEFEDATVEGALATILRSCGLEEQDTYRVVSAATEPYRSAASVAALRELLSHIRTPRDLGGVSRPQRLMDQSRRSPLPARQYGPLPDRAHRKLTGRDLSALTDRMDLRAALLTEPRTEIRDQLLAFDKLRVAREADEVVPSGAAGVE